MHALSAMPVGVTLDLGFPYPPGYEPELSDDEVLTIQSRYLEQTLGLLTDERASTANYRHTIDWIAVPLVRLEEIEDLPVVAFQRCCYAYGVDPETIQECVLRMVAPNRLAELGYD